MESAGRETISPHPIQDSLGFPCPDCKHGMAVIKVRKRVGFILRRRRCPVCGKRQTTREQVLGVHI